MTAKDKPTPHLPTISQFCLEVPLYQKFHLDDGLRHDLYTFVSAAENIDCFCVECGKDSVFNGQAVAIGASHQFSIHDMRILKRFVCSRDAQHEIFFHFRVQSNVIEKIGQSPAHAELSGPAILKYRKILSENDFKELHRAVGLVTHGVGIGAFVYLRRIFEKLIEEAHVVARQRADWEESEYIASRMSERIGLLKDFLPSFLVEQIPLYSILSKGVHELTEQECLEAFPVVRIGIELILDEKLEKKNREDKMKSVSKEIAKLNQKHP